MAASRRVIWKLGQVEQTETTTETEQTSEQAANDDGAIKSSVVSAVAPIAIVRYISALERPKALRYKLPPNPQQPTTVEQRFNELEQTMLQEEIRRVQALPDFVDVIMPELQKAGIGTLAEVSTQNLQNFMPGGDVTQAVGPQAKDYPRLYQRFQDFLANEARGYQSVMMRMNQQPRRAAWKLAQAIPAEPMAPAPAAPAAAPVAESPEAQLPGPLSTGTYVSVEQLKNDLIRQGPGSDLYNKILQIVGPESEDDAKGALGDFFQGVPGAIHAIYDMLVQNGMASPLDQGLLEEIMQQHPQLNPNNDPNQQKQAGLFLPPPDSGLYSTDAMQKTASGGVGSTSPQGGYTMYGPDDCRMCPKIRNVVSTFICRYHCLDGIQIDDQVVCGEAIWRGAIMDKFSREYRDKDGNWVGGYINDRFEVDRNTGGHPYQLKPGQRHAPIHEDAWSTEKRLEEMRRSQGDKRGYSDTPGDPKKLYNFDQHELAKGPRSPQLYVKKKDQIAKLAGNEKKAVLSPEKLLEVARAVATHWDQVGKTMETPEQANEEMDQFLTKNFPDMKEYVGVQFVQGPTAKVAGYYNRSMAKKAQRFDEQQYKQEKIKKLIDGYKAEWGKGDPYGTERDLRQLAAGNQGFWEDLGDLGAFHDMTPADIKHVVDTLDQLTKKATPPAAAPAPAAPAVAPAIPPATAGAKWSLKKTAINIATEPEKVQSQRKMCPFCGVANSAMDRMCHRCKQDISKVSPDSVAEVCSDTGAMFKQDPLMKIKASPDLKIRTSNGVYMASLADKKAFADSYDEALEKLAQAFPAPVMPTTVSPKKDPLNKELAQSTSDPVEEQNQKIQNMREQLNQAPAAPQAPGQVAAPGTPQPTGVVNNNGVGAVPTPGAVAQPPKQGDPLLEGWEAMPGVADAEMVENNIKAGLPPEPEQAGFNNLVDNFGGTADSNTRNVKVKALPPRA